MGLLVGCVESDSINAVQAVNFLGGYSYEDFTSSDINKLLHIDGGGTCHFVIRTGKTKRLIYASNLVYLLLMICIDLKKFLIVSLIL